MFGKLYVPQLHNFTSSCLIVDSPGVNWQVLVQSHDNKQRSSAALQYSFNGAEKIK